MSHRNSCDPMASSIGARGRTRRRTQEPPCLGAASPAKAERPSARRPGPPLRGGPGRADAPCGGPAREARSAAVEWELPRDPAAAAIARRRLGDHLAELGVSELIDDGRLLVSELVANALEHATGAISLRILRSDEGAHCEVVDGGPYRHAPPGQAPPAGPRHAAEDASESGRGLLLVAALAAAWGIEPRGAGKAVWFDLRSG
ncbi:ATP-binding protein [Yinghuangia sp. ASG 101]|uniref:ATP-binding protein n=1 Tax=Yinghuangia sp. ASG 101 TaxID=2896848 RepID=UPI001E3D9EEA|nr:ATP-binding protein [Yinghuangia sp. ASG 101]UGQ12020.1 ATP-binding protein [Yinghuangia sp. ASG 101]